MIKYAPRLLDRLGDIVVLVIVGGFIITILAAELAWMLAP
jgi:hypothetical protein